MTGPDASGVAGTRSSLAHRRTGGSDRRTAVHRLPRGSAGPSKLRLQPVAAGPRDCRGPSAMTVRNPAAHSHCTAALLAACHPAAKDETARPAGTALGIQTSWMDTGDTPGDDWYEYANGDWMKPAQIT